MQMLECGMQGSLLLMWGAGVTASLDVHPESCDCHLVWKSKKLGCNDFSGDYRLMMEWQSRLPVASKPNVADL